MQNVFFLQIPKRRTVFVGELESERSRIAEIEGELQERLTLLSGNEAELEARFEELKNAKLEIDPDFLKADDHDHHHHDHDHHHHDHEHGEHCDHPHHHHHDDDVKSFVFRADKPFNPAKLEDFLGAIVQVYGPKMLRYKGVLHMKGTDKKVIFQGVHQMMGSDLGPKWMPGEKKQSKMVFIGIDLPKDVLMQGLEGCLA